MPGKGRGGETSDFSKFGTNGDDTLNGSGGSYRLAGGKGDDTYLVDEAADVIDEKKNHGYDTVIASDHYVLYDNLEELHLTGTGNINGTGNNDDNVLVGNSGDNILFGGLGSNTLDGGDGIDTAKFSGSVSDYVIDLGDTEVLVTSIYTYETTRLTNIEKLEFYDETIYLTAPPSPTPVVASRDVAETDEDTSILIDLLSNDAGEGLTIVSISNGSIGSVTDNRDGTITYTPSPDTYGVETLTYTVQDTSGAESTATIEIEILPVNDAPIALDDDFDVGGNPLLSGSYNVLNNDVDADGDPLRVASAGTSPDSLLDADQTSGTIAFTTEAGGTIELNADGSFSYTPSDGYSGSDTFSYSVVDTSGEASSASVLLNVAAVPESPAPEETPYYVDALLLGDRYRVNAGEPYGSEAIVTYAFAESTPDYYEPDSRMHVNFQSFTEAQRDATVSILDQLDSFTNLTFVETSIEEAEMVFGIADIGSSGLAYLPGYNGVGNTKSDVWLDDGFASSDFASGSTAFKTLIHEIGHALGMEHPILPDGEETRQYTVMAGYRHETMGLEEPSTYMLYDIAALQHYYGVDSTTTAGDDVYTFDDLAGSISTIWDAAGHDVIDMSAATYGVEIDLNQGAFSTIDDTGSENLAIAFGTEIENVRGSQYDDKIVGNELDNLIAAGSGNDELTGGQGADIYSFASEWGQDVITDFHGTEDQIDLSGLQISIEDLFISSDAENMYLEFEAGKITLSGVSEDELDEDWVVF